MTPGKVEEDEPRPVLSDCSRPNGLDAGANSSGNDKLVRSRTGHNSSSFSPVTKDESRLSSMAPEDAKTPSESASTSDAQANQPRHRKSSKKKASKPPVLLNELPDKTEESCSSFLVINECLYGSKHMGSSNTDTLDCDCAEDWRDSENRACGEDSDCINRLTKMECVGGNCGPACQNQRFQQKQYADVSVIQTQKKGYGLRTNTDLQANDFIFEYIGEVVNEPTFRRRMRIYDEDGIKHFYFMSLTKSEFIDATKKGNLGRFCNHSCNPNCYVDKWVVGGKLRMGIFANRTIKSGEELVFDYNVDRYGAEPQPCYCGEYNCNGFIGGKTQTDSGTKLNNTTIEALGIDDQDAWETAAPKKTRKKKVSEDDEDYVNSLKPRSLTEDDASKVMATLLQCKEKWVVVKLLTRIQNCDDTRVINRIARIHAYQIFKTVLNTWKEDHNIALQILEILYLLPRVYKNKITDSKIEGPVEELLQFDNETVQQAAQKLLDAWNNLETVFRIPRQKKQNNLARMNAYDERRGETHKDEQSAKRPPSPVSINAPRGPRSAIPQRNPNYFPMPVAQRHRNFSTSGGTSNLPRGWFATRQANGRVYYYTKNGQTSWVRPTKPAVEAQPQQSHVDTPKEDTKAVREQRIQDLIRQASTQAATPRQGGQTPKADGTPEQDTKKEPWRKMSKEKQMKMYENTLHPLVMHIVKKFSGKLPKDDLKRFARDVNKNLVKSDYKHDRVDDPTSISESKQKKVKHYVTEYFNKAVKRHIEREKRRTQNTEKAAKEISSAERSDSLSSEKPCQTVDTVCLSDADVMSDIDGGSPGSEKKRKRQEDELSAAVTPTPDYPLAKRIKEEDESDPQTPPPPPPPPPEDEQDAEEERMMLEEKRKAEEALERENEEALRDFERETTCFSHESKLNGTNGITSASSNTHTPTTTQSTKEAPKDPRPRPQIPIH